MNGSPIIRHDKNTLHHWLRKWLGANRGTHWTIAGSVAVIILGTYLIYNIREASPTIAAALPAAEPTVSSLMPAPLPLKK
jgi:hypothetical protein